MASSIVTLIAKFGEQRKKLTFNTNIALGQANEEIRRAFDFENEEEFSSFQIQYYDQTYKKFIDLDERTEADLHKLLEELSKSLDPDRSGRRWMLKIVPKGKKRKYIDIEQTKGGETYVFQHDSNRPTEHQCHAEERRSRSRSISTSRRDRSASSASASAPSEITVQNIMNDAQDADYHVDFNFTLKFNQRSQYATDVFVEKKNGDFRHSGKLIETAPKETSDPQRDLRENASIFRVPPNEIDGGWSLYLYIVLQETNGINHYIHISKGIYYHRGDPPHQREEPKNPCIISLSPTDVENGYHFLPIKISNFKGKKGLEGQSVRLLPSVGHRFTTDDEEESASSHETITYKMHNGVVKASCLSGAVHSDPNRRKKEKP